MSATGRRTIGVLVGVAVLAAACTGPGDGDAPTTRSAGDAPLPDAVRVELVRLGEEDQEPRRSLTPEKMGDTVFARALLQGDSARTARLQVIVEEHGWPDAARAGEEAAQAAFLILQHSPEHAFQRRMLPELEALAGTGGIPAEDVAMLVDRVLMHEGSPQRYGTQFSLVEGRWVLHPLEDDAGLDARRAAVGLPPMEEYMRLLEEATGTPVERAAPPPDSP